MKTVLLIICFLSTILFVSCSNTNDKINSAFELELGANSTKTSPNTKRWDKLTDEKFYKYKLLKDKIDNIMNITPLKSEELFSSPVNGHLCSSYTWESPKNYVNMYIDFDDKTKMIELTIKQK